MAAMFDKRPTYDIASDQVASHVTPLNVGDLALPFEARDQDGRMLLSSEDHISGQHMILVFLNTAEREQSIQVLKSFADKRKQLSQQEATVIAISSTSNAKYNAVIKEESGFHWPILGDAAGSIFAQYGIHKCHGQAYRIVLITPFRQIRCWHDSNTDLVQAVEDIMDKAKVEVPEDNQKWFPCHAPVLIIPNVLSPEECKQLIDHFENQGPMKVARFDQSAEPGGFKMPIYEHNRQDRVDHIIREKKWTNLIDQRIGSRINPMIKMAFSVDINNREDLHVARYFGERGGNQMGHRDNTGPTVSYRRFALSMNLNDDFEGGEVVFKEFNNHGYRAAPGTALIFSSSLLHEVMETTDGTRYNLISHLFYTPPKQPQQRQPVSYAQPMSYR